MKKEIKIVILIIFLVLAVIFRFNIRYFIDGGKNVVFAPPDTFYLDLFTEKNIGELYYLSNEKYNQANRQDGYNEATNTYHLFVDSLYINNNDSYLSVSGNYWNYPYKPVIKVNGDIIDDDLINIRDTGYADGIFSKIYFSKTYQFRYDNRIYSERVYEFYVRINDYSQSVNVIFHEN